MDDDTATDVAPAADDLLALCPKCHHQLGEHDGSKCPKPEKAKRGRRPPAVAPEDPPAPPAAAPPMALAPITDPGRYEPAIDVADIMASPTNRNAKVHLEELARSIAEKGVINPITVRPARMGSGYELVAGERRWRASQLAGRTTIPALVRDLSDVEVLEVQLIENVQREDVHPLEEADGYQLLIARHGYTVERIVEKTGKSKGWVYGRLKLCSLARGPRAAFLAGDLQPSIALMIARIPTQALQEQATAGVLGGGDWQAYDQAGVQSGSIEGKREPLNVRQATAYVHRHYMLRLELAKFDITDATLVPAAGSCTGCIHRTGNQRELFADVAAADVCTNPPCHEAKTKAAFERVAAVAKDRGVAVLAGKKADGLFREDHHGGQELSHEAKSQYFDPKAEVPWDVWTDTSKKPPTWAKVLGKELDQVPRILAQDGTGAPRELFDKAAAVAALKRAGKIESGARRTGTEVAAAKEARDRQDATKRRRAVVEVGIARLAAAGEAEYAEGKGGPAQIWWRWVADMLARSLGYDDQLAVSRALRLDVAAKDKYDRTGPARAIRAAIEIAGVGPCRGMVVAMLGASGGAAGGTYSAGYGEAFTDACKVFGVDLKKLQAEVAKVEPRKPAPAGKKPTKKSRS